MSSRLIDCQKQRAVETHNDERRGPLRDPSLDCRDSANTCSELAEELLARCANLRVLATSREQLGVAGDIVWRVPSMSVPAEAAASRPGDLARSDAARLFVDRARAGQHSFRLDEASAGPVGQICRRLDGIPLAIELAAARVAVLSPAEIARRLDDCLEVPAGGSRTGLPRHRTLIASMEWSHGLLDDVERALFRRLAVFAGGFALDAARSVCADDRLGAARVLDVLSRLVAKSLVSVEEHGTTRRYRLLETVRQYAADRLNESGESAAVHGGRASSSGPSRQRTAVSAPAGDRWIASATGGAASGWSRPRSAGPCAAPCARARR